MDTHTPQDFQQYHKQQVLEKKLQSHIQREFDLGEKVISLLKEKKALETSLQDQLHAKEELGKKLAETITGKNALEQKFFQVQRELREQQRTLRRRSRRIGETEEGSRKDLKTLREEIRHLKEQLEILDMRKVEEHVRLSNKIKELYNKESSLKQELQKIAYQKELVEEELNDTMQRCQELSTSHDNEEKQHEQRIEMLQRQQTQLEIHIAHLLDEQKRNEQKLQKEIDTLKLSKAQLEEQVEHLKQQSTDKTRVLDTVEADLLHVIEEQEQSIQNLKEKAHQRSVMLRSENESLRKEMEGILATQQKMSWENQMLESSLKGLQHALAEYIQLKKKFEEVQQEKEHFEEAFYKKIQFLENHYTESHEPQELSHVHPHQKKEPVDVRRFSVEKQVEPPLTEPQAMTAPPDKSQSIASKPVTSQKKSRKTAQRSAATRNAPPSPQESWNGLNRALLIAVVMLIAVILGIVIYTQLPVRRSQVHVSTDIVLDLPEEEFLLPEEDAIFSEGELLFSEDEFAPPESKSEQNIVMEKDSSLGLNSEQNIVMEKDSSPGRNNDKPTPKNNTKTNTTPRIRKKEPDKKSQVTPPKSSIDIVVQLSSSQDSRFLPNERKPKVFPTIENNVVLRRHYEQKHSDMSK